MIRCLAKEHDMDNSFVNGKNGLYHSKGVIFFNCYDILISEDLTIAVK